MQQHVHRACDSSTRTAEAGVAEHESTLESSCVQQSVMLSWAWQQGLVAQNGKSTKPLAADSLVDYRLMQCEHHDLRTERDPVAARCALQLS
jgi:hypothetical protein